MKTNSATRQPRAILNSIQRTIQFQNRIQDTLKYWRASEIASASYSSSSTPLMRFNPTTTTVLCNCTHSEMMKRWLRGHYLYPLSQSSSTSLLFLISSLTLYSPAETYPRSMDQVPSSTSLLVSRPDGQDNDHPSDHKMSAFQFPYVFSIYLLGIGVES